MGYCLDLIMYALQDNTATPTAAAAAAAESQMQPPSGQQKPAAAGDAEADPTTAAENSSSSSSFAKGSSDHKQLDAPVHVACVQHDQAIGGLTADAILQKPDQGDLGQESSIIEQQQQWQAEEAVQSNPACGCLSTAAGQPQESGQQQQQVGDSGISASRSSCHAIGPAAADEGVPDGLTECYQQEEQQHRETLLEGPLTVPSASARLLSYATTSEEPELSSSREAAEEAAGSSGVLRPLVDAVPYAAAFGGAEDGPCFRAQAGCSSATGAVGSSGACGNQSHSCR